MEMHSTVQHSQSDRCDTSHPSRFLFMHLTVHIVTKGQRYFQRLETRVTPRGTCLLVCSILISLGSVCRLGQLAK